MPTHWYPRSCFGRYSSCKRTKLICPSNELLLIWHMRHKWYGIILISSSHMRLSVAQPVGLVPLWAISTEGSSWGKWVKCSTWEIFLLRGESFRDISGMTHRKNKVKIPISLKSMGFLPLTPGEPGFLSKILWKRLQPVLFSSVNQCITTGCCWFTPAENLMLGIAERTDSSRYQSALLLTSLSLCCR